MTTADACFVTSATLVATTFTVCVVEIEEGAVYNPVVVTDPTWAGDTDHVTAVLVFPLTVAANCAWPPAESVAALGETPMLTEAVGCKVTTADACFVLSATLVAHTVTDCGVEIVGGAVYNPVVLIDPAPAGEKDQITEVLGVPVTAAENC